MKIDEDIILIAGPTASGKTSASIKIAQANDAVIFNSDSMQVYEDLRIISARPSDEEISMYFIFDLPKKSTKNTGIMVVVDKLSKRTHFIALNSKINAKETADLFYKEIYKHHGIPRKIISDRDSMFTSSVWRNLKKTLQVKLNLSTAFHPQTDGQSERALRVLKEMLRCYVNSMQNDWEKFLPGLEFAYNNSINESTKHTPFY